MLCPGESTDESGKRANASPAKRRGHILWHGEYCSRTESVSAAIASDKIAVNCWTILCIDWLISCVMGWLIDWSVDCADDCFLQAIELGVAGCGSGKPHGTAELRRRRRIASSRQTRPWCRSYNGFWPSSEVARLLPCAMICCPILSCPGLLLITSLVGIMCWSLLEAGTNI